MANKLSYSQIKLYTECGYKYYLHYRKNLRSKYMHSALLYGSAIDESLNVLLLERNLQKAEQKFYDVWEEQWINGVKTQLSIAENLVYAERDFDEELLDNNDLDKLEQFAKGSANSPMVLFHDIKVKKQTNGFDNLTSFERQYYNYANWLSLRHKGIIMIRSYNKKVMPNVEEVLAVQHKFKLTNDVGDEVVAIADAIVKWKDGRVLLLDNKTSAREYEKDQASRSQQLITYWHQLKEPFKLSDEVGFVVMNKNILKNKVKICSSCGHNGSGSRARTCDNSPTGERCGAAWLEHISPECKIDFIINRVTPEAETLVLESIVDANQGIGNEYWYKNLSACKNGPIVCQFYNHCWKQKIDDLVVANK